MLGAFKYRSIRIFGLSKNIYTIKYKTKNADGVKPIGKNGTEPKNIYIKKYKIKNADGTKKYIPSAKTKK